MRKVEQFFNDYAVGFDSIYGQDQSLLSKFINPIFRKSMHLRFEKTLEYCCPVKNQTVLDIGCGPGHYCLALAQRGAEKVVGLDFSEKMIQISKTRASDLGLSQRCEFIVQDFIDYDPNEKFSYVIIMGVMDYIENPESFIKKVGGLTQKKAFFSFPVEGGILALQRKFRYKKRCVLFMYTYDQLNAVFNELFPHKYTIEKISRDYFVTINFES